MSKTRHLELPVTTFECKSCGLHYQDQGLRDIEEQTRYELHENTPNPNYVTMFERILTEIEPFIFGDVLDYGSGQYKVLEQLLDKRYNIESYDLFFHPRALSTYDTILAIEVVEHFIDPDQEWTKLLSLVRPGGHLIVQTRFVEQPFFSWWYQRDPTHRTFYTKATFDKLATKAGFTVAFSNNHSIIVMKRGG